jgi:hypothetical protein
MAYTCHRHPCRMEYLDGSGVGRGARGTSAERSRSDMDRPGTSAVLRDQNRSPYGHRDSNGESSRRARRISTGRPGGMAHHSWLSPDGKWILVSEMDRVGWAHAACFLSMGATAARQSVEDLVYVSGANESASRKMVPQPGAAINGLSPDWDWWVLGGYKVRARSVRGGPTIRIGDSCSVGWGPGSKFL